MSYELDFWKSDADGHSVDEEDDQEWSTDSHGRYDVIILNDRLMSETVQSEHSYFNHLDDDSRDADISDSHSSTFKGECRHRLNFSECICACLCRDRRHSAGAGKCSDIDRETLIEHRHHALFSCSLTLPSVHLTLSLRQQARPP